MPEPLQCLNGHLLVALDDHDCVAAPAAAIELHGGDVDVFMEQHGGRLGHVPRLIQVVDN